MRSFVALEPLERMSRDLTAAEGEAEDAAEHRENPFDRPRCKPRVTKRTGERATTSSAVIKAIRRRPSAGSRCPPTCDRYSSSVRGRRAPASTFASNSDNQTAATAANVIRGENGISPFAAAA